MSLSAGLRSGLCSGLHSGFNPTCDDSIPGVTRDSTSRVYTPGSFAEWETFLAALGDEAPDLPPPEHLWLLQEASGNPVDTIGGKTLTATGGGNAPAYQRTIPGWSRKAIGGPGIAANSSLSNTLMVNTATTSFLVLLLARSAPATVLRSICAYGTPAIQQPVSNKTRFRLGASIVDSTNDHAGATVHPYLFAFSVSISTCKLYTDLEKITLTFSASAGSVLTLQCASASDATAADFLYAAAWDASSGDTIDSEAKKLITGLGFNPPWS